MSISKTIITLFILSILFSNNSFSEADSIDAFLAKGDEKMGQQLALQCLACHNITKKAGIKVGPNLWNIVNRPIASIDDFQYSSSMKTKQGIWDYQTLNTFLFSPSDFAPDTVMILPGIKDQANRVHLIAYLRSLSDKPALLPKASSTGELTSVKDPFGTDWPQGSGRNKTGHTCNVCHSLAIVKQQGQTQEGWDELMDWMIEEQGMAELSAEERNIIVNYLAKHFNINK